jgi:hypothetical protein
MRSQLNAQGYDIQAAHYLNGLRALGIGDQYTDFLFLLVETEPPYSTALVGLDASYKEAAANKIKLATKLWLKCLETDKWPGYNRGPWYAEAPSWMLAEFETKKLLQGA